MFYILVLPAAFIFALVGAAAIADKLLGPTK